MALKPAQLGGHSLNPYHNERHSSHSNSRNSMSLSAAKLKNRSIPKLNADDSERDYKGMPPNVAAVPITAATLTSAKLCIENKQNRKLAAKTPAKLSTINPAIAANKPKIGGKKQVCKESRVKKPAGLVKKEIIPKSSEESDSDSETESDEESSSTTSESEATASSHSFSSHGGKASKNKRGNLKNSNNNSSNSNNNNNSNKVAQTDTDEDETTPRKLTRSFSNRVNKQLKTNRSHTESTTDNEDDKTSKNPARKALLTNGFSSKNKFKKENYYNLYNSNQFSITAMQPHMMSPPCVIEKKCPIEGCDSSGHLSGCLDRHFLPDACPVYHNMTKAECIERANERKIRNELRAKVLKALIPSTSSTSATNASSSNALNAANSNTAGTTSGANNSQKNLTPEQREFLAKIQESRANFKPYCHLNDKIKVEREFGDEDREPNLNGFVPDYDLQLFREAQAIASQKIEAEVQELPVGKGIKYITMGKYKMKVWYQSPYPDDAARLPQMYICEFCLRYQKSETSIKRHAQKCVWRHPPGDEIYRKGKLQVWQIDGKRQKQYCQHLCLLAKFFLDHKTLYYDVEPFLFYVMTLADVDGCHTVGYFSKEKNSFYNVSCILTLPPYQRKGYGRLLIDFSYLLTRVEGKIGSPEKPLSDLGLISYRSYWKDVLLDFLCNRSGSTLSIKDVSQEMAIYSYDIVSTLQALGMMKYWKGKHIVLKKQDVLDEYAERVKRRGTFPKIDQACLRWSPFVPTQTTNSL